MTSKKSDRVSEGLREVRITRGILMFLLALIYYVIMRSYYAHQAFINYPLAVFDPFMVGFISPFIMMSFIFGLYDVIYHLSETDIPYHATPILGFSTLLETIMVVLLYLLGVLIVPFYVFFMAISLLHFVFFLYLTITEISILYRGEKVTHSELNIRQ